MLRSFSRGSGKINVIGGGLLAACVAVMSPASAEDMTAGSVLTKMKPDQRFPYLAGIVEGLAHARYQRDDKATEGMACIYDWFYRTEGSAETIYAAFEKFKNHTPGAVMAALIQRRCGE